MAGGEQWSKLPTTDPDSRHNNTEHGETPPAPTSAFRTRHHTSRHAQSQSEGHANYGTDHDTLFEFGTVAEDGATVDRIALTFGAGGGVAGGIIYRAPGSIGLHHSI